MKSEPGISRREADDLLALMGDDEEEMRSKLAEVLRSELAGSKRARTRDIGRLRR
jgi:hypothetical protein